MPSKIRRNVCVQQTLVAFPWLGGRAFILRGMGNKGGDEDLAWPDRKGTRLIIKIYRIYPNMPSRRRKSVMDVSEHLEGSTALWRLNKGPTLKQRPTVQDTKTRHLVFRPGLMADDGMHFWQ